MFRRFDMVGECHTLNRRKLYEAGYFWQFMLHTLVGECHTPNRTKLYEAACKKRFAANYMYDVSGEC